ncbi:MAG: ribosome assembly RNA-binding protein YhbY [Clostridia bacterium]|nr:ribosome assembly RNA-binding protein YhbY [Clostridia bacterium]MBR3687176.1 ribosome assembly RNA-binding protein YhbY [Clostridia bacterium]MBR4032340.1 ribosome assembly RNA-binding protein YhbY [Clostridia bacterium]
MITSKQRAYLRGLGQSCPAIMQIGKGGITENLIKTVSDALEARELVKLTVLENSGENPREALDKLCEALGAEGVSAVGRKIVLYRESKDKKTIELPR